MSNFLNNFRATLQPYLPILILFLGINLFIGLICTLYHFQRPLFNIDYLFLIFSFYKRNILSSIILFIVAFISFFTDILLLVLQIFPFIKLSDFLYLSTFIFNGPVLYQIITLSLILIFFFLFFLIKNTLRKHIQLTSKQWFSFVLTTLILMSITLIPSANKIIDSQLKYYLQHNQSDQLSLTGEKPIIPLSSDYLSKSIFTAVKNQQLQSKKILFIVNESWGETATPEQQDKILEPITRHKDQLSLYEQGSFPIVGATVMGEVRELCGKKLQVMDIHLVDTHEFSNCLPNQLQKQGFKTIALHGADSLLYARDYWYPLSGFQQSLFAKDLIHGGICKAFHGRCDTMLIPTVKDLLLQSEKSFVYWMTLNTHTPYDDNIFIQGLDCQALGINPEGEACGNYKLQYQFFSALSTIINDPQMKGVDVYVVGDHPPPIMDLKDGYTAFKGTDVAWMHFKIK